LAAAQSPLTAACGAADSLGTPVSVAVADRAGNVVASARMGRAALGSMRLALGVSGGTALDVGRGLSPPARPG
jgi:uncharacterized protein GlcG (DUF336 family)